MASFIGGICSLMCASVPPRELMITAGVLSMNFNFCAIGRRGGYQPDIEEETIKEIHKLDFFGRNGNITPSDY